jgi:ketol-acid reductoisomerase
MRLHMVGFGSQGSAWAEGLRTLGHDVSIFLRPRSASFERARDQGYAPLSLAEIQAALSADEMPLVAMLVPDHLIGPLYRDHLAQVERPLTLVLAHGYAVYSGELARMAPGHEAALLAPKAIGPKLAAAGREARAAGHASHSLRAAFFASPAREPLVRQLASGLGFAPENLIPASFAQETVGDLISEQALLCGGVFNLIEWTMQAMRDAGVPPALIKEECLTELELIAGLVRARGASETLGLISQAAQCGTILMRRRLEAAGVPDTIARQADSVVKGEFTEAMRDPAWRAELEMLRGRLARLEEVR